MHPGVIFAYTRVHPSASQAFTRQFAALGGATKIPPGAPEAAKQPPQKLSPAKLPEMRLLSTKRAVFVDRAGKMRLLSMKRAVFVDRAGKMRLLSMKRAVFVDRRSPIWSGMTEDTVWDDGRYGRG